MSRSSTFLLLLAVALLAGAAARTGAYQRRPMSAPAAPRWEAIRLSTEWTTGPAGRLRDLEISAGGHGLAVVNGSRLWRTSDGGRTWNMVRAVLPGAPQNWVGGAVAVRDDAIALLSLSSGKIFRTNDGGETWSMTREGDGRAVLDITFVDEDAVVAVGPKVLVRSIDAGHTWKEVPVPRFNYESAAFGSARLGLAVGGAGIVLRSEDAGETWERTEIGSWDLLHSVAFADARTAVIVGSSGTILRSADAGESWARITSPTRQHLSGVTFLDARVGLAAGTYGTILRTEDAGLTWREEPSGTVAHLNDVRLAGDGAAFAIGWLETILRLPRGSALGGGR